MRRSTRCLFVVLAFSGLHCAPTDPGPRTKGNGKVQVQPDVPVTPNVLKDRIEAALKNVHERDLATTYGFWTIFHAILGMGPENTYLVNPETKERVNAIEHICKGNQVRGLRFFTTPHGLDVETATMPDGKIAVFVGQGHQDQFVAEMVQWGLPADRTFVVEGKTYTFKDFINHTKMRASVTQKQELSWAILVIGEHFGTNHEWTNSLGEKLKFEDVVRYELNEPIDTAACGGTHRLFGLTWVLHRHRQFGGKLEGVWKELNDKLIDHKYNAKKNRNGDGCFSTDYFKGKGDLPDNGVRISTTGHILEWLSLYMTDDELKEPWVQEAAGALARTILATHSGPVETGALYHAAHGLQMYHDRIYGDPKGKRPFPLPVR